jgi:hypothetical protein
MSYYLIILCILIALYASFYFIFNDEITIYQTRVNNFDYNLLYTKQPLVIEDSVENIDIIIHDVFNSNIVHYNVMTDKLWTRNKYKYLLVYADENTVSEVTLYHPSKKLVDGMPLQDTDSLITIKLTKKKVLIIPFKWYYNIVGNVQLHGIHDIITYPLQYIIG